MTPHLTELTSLIHWIHRQGWSPATSTNYSMRCEDDKDACFVSRSGVDKSQFVDSDFLRLAIDGVDLDSPRPHHPSAETGIHLMLYRETPCQFILHTHSLADTLLSRLYVEQGYVDLVNYELLKGLAGVDTHTHSERVPIFANDQDIERLSIEMGRSLTRNTTLHGMLIESHGFYTWGNSLAEAKRHLEVFQFLFQCELELARLPKD